MLRSASGVGLVPEQAWEDPDLAADPYGTDPTTASIGFADGHAAGSASPLTWAQAQQLRLITDLGTGRVGDRPDITTRPLRDARPAGHRAGDDHRADRRSGRVGHDHGQRHDGAARQGDGQLDRHRLRRHHRSWPRRRPSGSGAYSVAVPVGVRHRRHHRRGHHRDRDGLRAGDGAGRARRRHHVLDVTDPAGDDNGPGTYQYPTNAVFVPGAFDITRFQVLTKDGTVYLRTTLRDLAPTFGSTLGAQLLDVYVHRAGASPTSTAAALSVAQLLDRAGRRVEPAPRGAGLRAPGVGRRRRQPGGRAGRRRVAPRRRRSRSSCPQATLGTPALGLVVRGGADRAGRQQPRPGARRSPPPRRSTASASARRAARRRSAPSTRTPCRR